MSLREKINQQFNAALKNKDKNLVSTLRLILAAIKDRDIAIRGSGSKEVARSGNYKSFTKNEETKARFCKFV